ncbi:MAG TPA: hypothetical protein VJI13_06335 [Candidatus Norongarragalinales archaeon]|nr:hypothetical protein [Candidatus Norongarragalinales archaeon]
MMQNKTHLAIFALVAAIALYFAISFLTPGPSCKPQTMNLTIQSFTEGDGRYGWNVVFNDGRKGILESDRFPNSLEYAVCSECSDGILRCKKPYG